MKTFIKTIVTLSIFVCAIMLCFSVPVKVSAADSELIVITRGGTETKYSDIYTALGALQDGDTIKFLGEITRKSFPNVVTNGTIDFDDDVTVDLNNQKVEFPLMIKENTKVKLIGGASSMGGTSKSPIIVEDNAKVTVDGGNYQVSYAPPLFTIGSNVQLEIKNATINSANICDLTGENSIVNIKDSQIKAGTKGFKVNGNKNTISVNGGNFHAMYGVLEINDNASNNTFRFEGLEELATEMEIKGSNNSVDIKDTMQRGAQSDYAVKVLGENNVYRVSGDSHVKGGYGAIYTDSPTAQVIIDNGFIETYNEDTDYNRLTPVIVSKNSGQITINGGTVTGQVGIAVFSGNVTINGGTVAGTNTDKEKYNIFYENKYFDRDYNYLLLGDYDADIDFYGAAVITDGENAKVNITGGTFLAATEETLVDAHDQNNYLVSGGIYDKPFNPDFVVANKVELTITDQEEETLWYVGQDAIDAVDQAKTDITNKIAVLQGDITINNASIGLSVTNTGDGKVTINKKEVAKGETVLASKMPVEKKPAKNPNTGDINIRLLLAMIIIGIFGLGYVIKKRLS